MNVEVSFIRTCDRKDVIEKIASRIGAPPDSVGKQPDWGLPSSYDALLAPERKRKAAISPLQRGWIAVVESKEVVDFAFLQTISEELRTEVVAVQVSDVVGACGYALCRDGVVQQKYFNEADEYPLASARAFLQEIGIPFDVLTFREAVQLRSLGWSII